MNGLGYGLSRKNSKPNMLNGDKEPAAKSYRKALEIDPKNTNAVKMLKKLEP